LNDATALLGVQRGNGAALDAIIKKYTPYVGAIAQGIIGTSMSEADIEEVCADVFITLWKNADKPSADKLKSWLGSVARNRAKNKLREIGASLSLDDDEIVVVADADVEGGVITNELAATVRNAVNALGNPDCEIFLRHYYYYQTVSTIADEMHLSQSAVKSRLARGREKLKIHLAERGVENEYKNFGLNELY
jgi:RNA polymerase sigma factor, sigma-70 family